MTANGHNSLPGSVNALFDTTVSSGSNAAGRYGRFSELITGTQITGCFGSGFRSSNLYGGQLAALTVAAFLLPNLNLRTRSILSLMLGMLSAL
jgi:hypothetical protein